MMDNAARLMREVLKEYDSPTKVRKSPYHNGRYKKGRKTILTSK